MAFHIRTKLHLVLPLLKAQVMTITGFPAERVVMQRPGGPLRIASPRIGRIGLCS